jgi:hypothetical protein
MVSGTEPEYHPGILKMKFIFSADQRPAAVEVEYNQSFPVITLA